MHISVYVQRSIRKPKSILKDRRLQQGQFNTAFAQSNTTEKGVQVDILRTHDQARTVTLKNNVTPIEIVTSLCRIVKRNDLAKLNELQIEQMLKRLILYADFLQ